MPIVLHQVLWSGTFSRHLLECTKYVAVFGCAVVGDFFPMLCERLSLSVERYCSVTPGEVEIKRIMEGFFSRPREKELEPLCSCACGRMIHVKCPARMIQH